jgi:hypothetical protein
MKEIFIASVLATLLVTQVFSEEKRYETLLGYKNVVVKKVLKDGIRVMYSGGFVKIAIEDLPEEVREELGMSMEGVEDYRKQEAAEAAARSKQLRARAKKRAVVIDRKKLLTRHRNIIKYGTVRSVAEGGCLIHVKTLMNDIEVEPYRFDDETEIHSESNRPNTVYFVKCKNDGLIDGYRVNADRSKVQTTVGIIDDYMINTDISQFRIEIWPTAKTYSYKTVSGATNTVRAWTTDPSDPDIAIFKRGASLIEQTIEERAKRKTISVKKKQQRDQTGLTIGTADILSVTEDGLLVKLEAAILPNYRYYKDSDFGKLIFIKCPSEGFVDGKLSLINKPLKVWPIGSYSYKKETASPKEGGLSTHFMKHSLHGF